MPIDIDIEFPLTTAAQTKEITSPFLKEYNLSAMTYARIFSDKSILSVHSDPMFAKLYLELDCSPMAPIPDEYWHYQSFFYLTNFCTDEKFRELQIANANEGQCESILYIINQLENYTEVMAVAGFVGDKDIVNRYLNHMKDLQIYTDYFSKKINQLFQEGDNRRLYLPPHLRPYMPENVNINLSYLKYEEFYRHLALKRIFKISSLKLLTRREIQCLFLLKNGHRYKEMGNYLSISSRTVETHLGNAKDKLGLNSLLDLKRKLKTIE
ncbi:helix-turn-helix transcriptional regulator [Legionella genomosp. 1]|uniref:helix-turn-helix transcriptional regulator n=1 Tax=Legionella genomosp. 1 TaxID=1093625 RepID=UPI0010551A97|nr:helix-turn-helix transcriptional regulator [Legionella genomosp. 1]